MLEIWTRILDVLDRLVNSGQGENLEEAVVECLKNELLVMNAGGFLVPEKVEIWRTTWSRIERFLPGLQKDLGLDIPSVGDIPAPQASSDQLAVQEMPLDEGKAQSAQAHNELAPPVPNQSGLTTPGNISRAQTPLFTIDPATGAAV